MIELNKKYITKNGRYEVVPTEILDKETGAMHSEWTYIPDKGFGAYQKGQSSSWYLDGSFHTGNSTLDPDLELILTIKPICNCVWNKHPAFCKCKD